MNKRKGILSGILTFVILLVGMLAYQALSHQKKETKTARTSKEALREVKVQQLLSTDALYAISIDGRLSPYETVNLFARVSGILLPNSQKVKKGMSFNQGDLLFDIDQEQARYQLFALRANLLNAITLVMPDLKLDHPQAYTIWKAYLDQFEAEQAVKPLPKVENERVKYYLASRNIYNLYYTIKSTEEGLKDYRIYAPVSGVISHAGIFPGTLVNPGQLLATLISRTRYELEAAVAERELKYVKIGNKVRLSSRAADREWTGTVRRIGKQIDPSTQNIPIYIELNSPELREGMYLNGKINVAALQDVFRIPRTAIVNQEQVFIVKDSIVGIQRLEIENRDEEAIYVRNFDPSVWVVMDHTGGLFTGQKVIPIREQRKPGE